MKHYRKNRRCFQSFLPKEELRTTQTDLSIILLKAIVAVSQKPPLKLMDGAVKEIANDATYFGNYLKKAKEAKEFTIKYMMYEDNYPTPLRVRGKSQKETAVMANTINKHD